jgi:RNA recognition motif-containing protein
MTRLFVGNLPFSTDETDLRNLFHEAYLFTSRISIVKDKMTERSRGFAFVEMADGNLAAQAVEKLNGTKVQNRRILVEIAKPKEK